MNSALGILLAASAAMFMVTLAPVIAIMLIGGTLVLALGQR